MPRFAAIDVGSNALRLRIVEATAPSQPAEDQLAPLPDRDGEAAANWRDLATLRAPVRLGAEVFVSGRLAPASIGQACDALRELPRRDGPREGRRLPRHRHERRPRGQERRAPSSSGRGARPASSSRPSRASKRRGSSSSPSLAGCPWATSAPCWSTSGADSTELTLLDHGKTAFTISLPLGTVRMLEALPQGRQDRRPRARAACSRRPSIARWAKPFRSSGQGRLAGGHRRQRRDALGSLPGQGRGRSTSLAAPGPLQEALRHVRQRAARRLSAAPGPRRHASCPPTAIFLRIAYVSSKLTHDPGAGRGAGRGVLEELVDKFFHVWDSAGEGERRHRRVHAPRPPLPLRRGARAAGHALRLPALRRPAHGSRVRRARPAAIARGRPSCTTSATTSTTAATTSTATT